VIVLAGGLRALIEALRSDDRGSMAIETAIVAPVLILLAFGSFQISSMVARQTELQTAAAEAVAVALASPPKDDVDLARLKDILKASTGLGDSDVNVAFSYRCENATAHTDNPDDCNTEAPMWSYVDVSLDTDYVPIWTNLGIGSAINLKVSRTVQVS